MFCSFFSWQKFLCLSSLFIRLLICPSSRRWLPTCPEAVRESRVSGRGRGDLNVLWTIISSIGCKLKWAALTPPHPACCSRPAQRSSCRAAVLSLDGGKCRGHPVGVRPSVLIIPVSSHVFEKTIRHNRASQTDFVQCVGVWKNKVFHEWSGAEVFHYYSIFLHSVMLLWSFTEHVYIHRNIPVLIQFRSHSQWDAAMSTAVYRDMETPKRCHSLLVHTSNWLACPILINWSIKYHAKYRLLPPHCGHHVSRYMLLTSAVCLPVTSNNRSIHS